ncbi:GrdX family protein [Thermanaeromonas sp. C210]|uniref:GrdX family protein n=1 Tax=Thermanaeromonas sp. C210 TaxID=2731925 RepID=UPI00155B9ADD|nr:GrdX family protein [Thermanaeromonas sp. C210]GFN22382.1 hypothetical protein TAMC210_06980 [Thermanaeromonas sp. C210]
MNVQERVLIITNNPDIKPVRGRVLFVPEGPLSVLREAQKLIFRGYTLLSHPLMGSLKPWQNPYRSVVLLKPPGRPAGLDTRSIILMGNAIAMMEAREREVGSQRDYDGETLEDFRRLDRELLGQAEGVWAGEHPGLEVDLGSTDSGSFGGGRPEGG